MDVIRESGYIPAVVAYASNRTHNVPETALAGWPLLGGHGSHPSHRARRTPPTRGAQRSPPYAAKQGGRPDLDKGRNLFRSQDIHGRRRQRRQPVEESHGAEDVLRGRTGVAEGEQEGISTRCRRCSAGE